MCKLYSGPSDVRAKIRRSAATEMPEKKAPLDGKCNAPCGHSIEVLLRAPGSNSGIDKVCSREFADAGERFRHELKIPPRSLVIKPGKTASHFY